MTVVIDADRLARLNEEAAALGVSRSDALRRRLDAAEPLDAPQVATPTRETTLRLLAQAAERGSVVAMATLARELRLGGPLEAARSRGERVNVSDLTREELGLRLVR